MDAPLFRAVKKGTTAINCWDKKLKTVFHHSTNRSISHVYVDPGANLFYIYT